MKTNTIRLVRPLVVAVAIGVVCMATGCGDRRTAAESFAAAKQKAKDGDPQAAIIEIKNTLQKDARNTEARLMLAELYLESRQPAQAEFELRRLASGNADPGRVRVLTARALLMQGNYNAILAEVQPSGDLDFAVNSELSEIRGEAFLALDQKADAAKAFHQALVDQPSNADAVVGQANLAMLGFDLPQARRLVGQVLERDPDHVRALLLKADIAKYAGQPEEALASYDAVLVKHPTNALALSGAAYQSIVAGHFDDGEARIAGIRKLGGAASANYLQSLIEFRQKKYQEALASIQKALAIAPNHLPSVMLAGAIEYQLGSFEQAERFMRQVIAASPNTVYAREVLALALMKLNRPGEAVDVLKPMVGAVEDAKLLGMMGEAYSQTKQYAKAAEMYSRAIAADPKNANAQLRLGANRLALGEADSAIGDFEEAIKLQPDSAQADFALIVTRLQRGDLDQALAAAKRFEARQPGNPIASNLRGGILLAKLDRDGARAAFMHALSIQPDFVPAAMNLARMDLEDKQPEAARRQMESLLAQSPNNVEGLVAYSNLLRELRAPVADIVAPLEKARAADPKAVQPRILLIQSLVASDPKRAASVAREVQGIEPSNPAVLDAVGVSQAASGETSGALATYAKLVEVAPRSALGHMRLAELYAQTGNDVAAIRELRTVLELNPQDRGAQLRLLAFEGRSGHSSEALKIAQQIEAESPKLAMGYVLEGDVWMASRKPQQAVAAYERANQVAPSRPLLLKLHAALVAAGRAADANARLNAWLASHPDDDEARLYYGNYLLRSAQYRPAADQYRKVVASQPDNVIALNDLAWLNGQLGDAQAIPLAEHAYNLAPNAVQVADTYGSLLVAGGQAKRGVEVLQKAADAAPTFYEMRLRLARGYVQLGDRIKARQQLESIYNSPAPPALRAEADRTLQALPR